MSSRHDLVSLHRRRDAAAASQRRFISSGSPLETLTGYSRAVVDGDWVFVSGAVGTNLRTVALPEAPQCRHCAAARQRSPRRLHHSAVSCACMFTFSIVPTCLR